MVHRPGRAAQAPLTERCGAPAPPPPRRIRAPSSPLGKRGGQEPSGRPNVIRDRREPAYPGRPGVGAARGRPRSPRGRLCGPPEPTEITSAPALPPPAPPAGGCGSFHPAGRVFAFRCPGLGVGGEALRGHRGWSTARTNSNFNLRDRSRRHKIRASRSADLWKEPHSHRNWERLSPVVRNAAVSEPRRRAGPGPR